jgi:hypothetical protein
MSRRIRAALMVATLGALLVPSLAVAQDRQIELLEDVQTVLAVAPIEDPLSPVGAIMRADCPFLVRIEAEDGSSQEFASCMLTDEPVDVPENQGSVPLEPFVESGGECIWTSDYAWATIDAPVFASEFETVALPSGRVHLWAAFPAEPLECDVEGLPAESPAAPEGSPEAGEPEEAEESPAGEEPPVGEEPGASSEA